MKVMTINMFRYHDWDNRKNNIVALVEQHGPDIVVMQEVLTNHAFSDKPQSDFVADECGYTYRSFAPTLLRMDARDATGERNQQASEGQAIIAKHPIISSENYFLRQYPDYPEDVSVQMCTLDIDGVNVEVCNVHFANNHIAYSHLDELLRLIKKRGSQPIIAGDFNIYKLAEYKQQSSMLNQYQLSSEVAEYISFAADGDSLDYIAAPNATYDITNVECLDAYVSDHKSVIATIEVAS